MKKEVFVPLEKVERIQIYINSKRKSLTQIMRETGAAYGINGTLYNMRTLAVNCHLKAEGALLCDPGYKAWGYAWDRGEDLHLALLPASAEKSYIACTLLARDGKAESKLYYDSGQGGKRGRAPSASRATAWPSTALGTAPGPPGRRKPCGMTW